MLPQPFQAHSIARRARVLRPVGLFTIQLKPPQALRTTRSLRPDAFNRSKARRSKVTLDLLRCRRAAVSSAEGDDGSPVRGEALCGLLEWAAWEDEFMGGHDPLGVPGKQHAAPSESRVPYGGLQVVLVGERRDSTDQRKWEAERDTAPLQEFERISRRTA